MSRGQLRTAATCLGAGVLVCAAVPPWGWWPLAFLGFAGLSRLLAGHGPASRAGRSALFSIGWFAPATVWMLDFSAPGWVIAVTLWAAMWALVGLVVPRGRSRWVALPAAVVLVEWLRWSWPFGGVPMATVAMTQADAPLAPTVRWLGPLLLVAAVVLVGVAIDAAVDGQRSFALAALGVAVLPSLIAPLAPRGETVDTIEVALVQGGGPQRTRAADTDEREVFERHVEATALIEGEPDLVLWPENVVNVEGPVAENPEGDELAALADELGVPLVVGVVEGDGDRFHNAAVVYEPGRGETDRFEKIRRVPFGEYVPGRAFVERFAGDALPDRDATVGESPAVVETSVGPLGVAISWEVFFAGRARDGIGNGGTILANPTNGSSYWLTIVQTQQLASSRLRSLETDRWTLQTAPTGLTAAVTPDGEVVARTGVSEQAVIETSVERRTGDTLSTRWGNGPVVALAAITLVAVWVRLRRRRATPKTA